MTIEVPETVTPLDASNENPSPCIASGAVRFISRFESNEMLFENIISVTETFAIAVRNSPDVATHGVTSLQKY